MGRQSGQVTRPDAGHPADGTLDGMTKTRVPRRKRGFLSRHALSLTAIAILLVWIALYLHADPKTHSGSFFGNAIADWSGVVVTVIATKYFYEIGSAESRQPGRRLRSRIAETLRDHSLTIFLGLTGAGWTVLYLKMDSEGKWTGSGKHRVGVDTTPGARSSDETADRGKIKGK